MDRQKVEFLASLAMTIGACYWTPTTIPIFAGTMVWKVGTSYVLSRLKEKKYISEQVQKSAKVILDPTWAFMYSYYPPHISTVLTPWIVNEATLGITDQLVGYAPKLMCAVISFFAVDGIMKLSRALAGGFLTTIVSKTLDQLTEPFSRYVESSSKIIKKEKVVPRVTSEVGIFTSSYHMLISQVVSEFTSPLGDFTRGFLAALTLYSISNSDPKIIDGKDKLFRSLYDAVSYSSGKLNLYQVQGALKFFEPNLDNARLGVVNLASSFTVINMISPIFRFWGEIAPSRIMELEVYTVTRRASLEGFRHLYTNYIKQETEQVKFKND